MTTQVKCYLCGCNIEVGTYDWDPKQTTFYTVCELCQKTNDSLRHAARAAGKSGTHTTTTSMSTQKQPMTPSVPPASTPSGRT